MGAKTQVYIIHGFEAYPQKHWFIWLQNELAKQNIQTSIPALPNPTNPNVQEWIMTLEKEVKNIHANTYFIGHSLGCITTLRFLSALSKETKIGGMIFVSGFDKNLEILPQLHSFTNIELDYKKLITLTSNRLVISARDDKIVPTNLSKILALNLKAIFLQTDTGNHFMQDDGFKTFPLLQNQLEFFFAQNQI